MSRTRHLVGEVLLGDDLTFGDPAARADGGVVLSHELAGRQRTQCEAVSGRHRVGEGHRAPLRERDLGAGSEAGLDDRDVVGRVHLDRALGEGEGEGRAGLGCGQRAFSGRECLL